MVEGHTDNVPIKNAVLLDNWDLSVKRSTSIVRVLQKDFNVSPKQLIPIFQKLGFNLDIKNKTIA